MNIANPTLQLQDVRYWYLLLRVLRALEVPDQHLTGQQRMTAMTAMTAMKESPERLYVSALPRPTPPDTMRHYLLSFLVDCGISAARKQNFHSLALLRLF